jgi:hypothetical protein
MPVSTRKKRKIEADNLLGTVFEYLLTTKTLSEFLGKPKDLCQLSACARSFLLFRCQLRKLEIRERTLTAGLLKHMESGGFADVATLRFEGLRCPVVVSEDVKDRLGSASRALSSLTSLELSKFVINVLDDFPPSLREQLQELSVDSFSAPAASIESLIQGSPNLHKLRLDPQEGMIAIEALARALETGGLKNLHTLVFPLNWDRGAHTYLRVLLTPILQGHAPNLKHFYPSFVLTDESIDLLLEVFPLLSLLCLQPSGFSQDRKARLHEAAKKYPGLLLFIF